MRKLLLFLLLASAGTLQAQNDDYPDYRNKKDNFLRVREKDLRSDLASFTMAGLDESMGKLPLKTIPLKELGLNYMIFEGENVQINIRSGAFDTAGHKLTYYDEKFLVRIDKQPFYGNYGTLPKNHIKEVNVIIDKDTVPIPSTAYTDIYDPGFSYKDNGGQQRSQNRVYISADKRTLYIYLLDRNRGGTEVTWIIRDKKFLKRVLDFGFMK